MNTRKLVSEHRRLLAVVRKQVAAEGFRLWAIMREDWTDIAAINCGWIVVIGAPQLSGHSCVRGLGRTLDRAVELALRECRDLLAEVNGS